MNKDNMSVELDPDADIWGLSIYYHVPTDIARLTCLLFMY